MVFTRKQYLWKFRLSGVEFWMFSLVYYSMGAAAIQKTEYSLLKFLLYVDPNCSVSGVVENLLGEDDNSWKLPNLF